MPSLDVRVYVPGLFYLVMACLFYVSGKLALLYEEGYESEGKGRWGREKLQ